MSETFGARYLVIGRCSAHKRSDVEHLLEGRPDFRVVVERRAGERRKSSTVIGSDNRSRIERRK